MPKLAPQTKLTELCSNAIEAFHRALGGRTFRHEKVGHGGNAACPFASGCTIGLRPSPTIPRNKHKFMDELVLRFNQIHTIWSTKIHQWKAREPQNDVLNCWEWIIMPNGTKNAKNSDLGLENRKSHEPSFLALWIWGGRCLGEKNFTLPPFMTIFVQRVLAQASSARLGELTLH